MFTTEQILRFIRRCHMKWGDFITLCKELRRIKGSNLLFLIKDFLRLCLLQVRLFMCDHTCQQGICASSKLLTKCMPWLKIRTATHPVGCELMCTSGHFFNSSMYFISSRYCYTMKLCSSLDLAYITLLTQVADIEKLGWMDVSSTSSLKPCSIYGGSTLGSAELLT